MKPIIIPLKSLTRSSHLWLLRVLSIVLAGCIDDSIVPSGPSTGKMTEIIFTVGKPMDRAGTSTRALDGDDEKKIDELTLILFQPNQGNYYHHVIPQPVSGSEDTYTVKVPLGTWDIMLLANSADIIRTSFPSGPTSATTMDEFITGLQLELPAEWNSTPGTTGYRSIPMWAYKVNQTITTSTQFTGDNGKFNLLRMLARVNLGLSGTAANTFGLKQVYVYNYYTKGQVIPTLTHCNTEYTGVTLPSIVEGNTFQDTPVFFKDTYDGELPGLENFIYLFEAAKGTDETFPTYPCIVIGGEYNGEMNFYRIDYINSEGNQLDILRNKSYNIDIQTISGPGYKDHTTAYQSKAINLEANVIVWDDGPVNVGTDGNYFLSIDKAEYEFSKDSRDVNALDNIVKIWTDHPDGWKVEDITDTNGNPLTESPWLTFGGETTGQGGYNDDGTKKKDTRNLVVTTNDSGAERKAVVHIKAGTITGKITVTQTPTAELRLEILDDEGQEVSHLFFWSGQGLTQVESKSFSVNWLPQTSNCEIEVIGYGAEIFNFGNGSGDVINNGDQLTGGSHSYTITPPPFNPEEVDPQTGLPFLQKAARVTFRVTNGTDTKTKVVDIVQENPAILIENFHQRVKAGQSYQMTVKSNQQWTITSVIDEDGILTGDLKKDKQGGLSVLTGDQLTYGISTNAGPARYADVVFRNNAGLFPDKTIRIYSADPAIANSYNIRPGTTQTIQLAKPYWVWGCEPLNTPLTGTPTAYLVWLDKLNLLGDLTLESSQDPRDYQLRVTANPGVEGNMLIGITIDGQTRWTYHIWVTTRIPQDIHYNAQGFFPNDYHDVNLGAIRTEMLNQTNIYNTDYNDYGMLYQWGRPTPFAGIDVRNNTSSAPHVVYDANGAVVDMNIQATTADFNLPNALMNPTTFYYTTNNLGDWYTPTERNLQNDYLWNDPFGEKTDFDPCPAGYRVPPMGLNNTVSPFTGFELDPDDDTKNGKYGLATPIGYLAPCLMYFFADGKPNWQAGNSYGTYHIGSTINNYSYLFFYSKTMLRESDFEHRAIGASVRCVKDQ